MKILIGLGNPGNEYAHTRHNIGYSIIDQIRMAWDFEGWKDSKFHGLVSEGIYEREKILLLKPTTYMNLSGESVASIVDFYKLDPKNDILTLSDDLDMEFAKIRYRKEGSHGGQNGLKSIIERLGTQEFSRIKIGIGRHEIYSVSDWVLSKFTKEEHLHIQEEVFPVVLTKIEDWIH